MSSLYLYTIPDISPPLISDPRLHSKLRYNPLLPGAHSTQDMSDSLLDAILQPNPVCGCHLFIQAIVCGGLRQGSVRRQDQADAACVGKWNMLT